MLAFRWNQVVSGILALLAIGIPLSPFAIGTPPAHAADMGAADKAAVADKAAKCFDGYDGTIVVRDSSGKAVYQFNDALAAKTWSPCSTFKIVLGLIGLETGAIKDENAMEKWDGTKQEIDAWNRDQSLTTAMNESVNWYFTKVSEKIGQAEIAKYLKTLHYGNEDMSSGLDNFWMGAKGSLRITPAQQVDFLERLYAEKLPFSARSQQIIKRVLKVDESPSAVLFGKTGTDQKNGSLTAGWFAGFVESKKGNLVFATHIEGAKNVTGRKAREITKKVLAELGYW